jgi:tetratricopeptide (TPR) repeat protein
MPAVILPQFLLMGILAPRDAMARWLEVVSDFLPLTYAYQALELAERLDDRIIIASACNNIGEVLWRVGDHDRALEFFARCLEIHHGLGTKANESIALLNIGAVHRGRGEFERALEYLSLALAAARECGARDAEGTALSEIGLTHLKLGDLRAARDYQVRSLRVARECGARLLETEVLVGLAAILKEDGEADKAVEALHEALAGARQIRSNELVYKAHRQLSELYELSGDFANALAHYKQFVEFHDEVLGQVAAQRIRSVIAQKEAEATQRETEALRAKNEELEAVLSQVKQLEGLLPICSYCKAVRDDQNYWQKIEKYISSRTNALFSHGICPSCYETQVRPQLDKLK